MPFTPGMLKYLITIQQLDQNAADVGSSYEPEWIDLLKDIKSGMYYRPSGTTDGVLGPQSFDRVEFGVWANDKLLYNPPSFYQIIYEGQTFRVRSIRRDGMFMILTAIVYYENDDESKLL